MKKSMVKVVVPVAFTGTVEVEVPARIPQERREALARKVALARVLATTENADAPEDDACAEYEAEFGLGEATAGRDWDGCVAAGVSGKWSPRPDAADLAAAVERLASKAESAGVRPEELDETVHELASSVAADVNNGGLEDQIRYLVEGLGAKYAERQLDDLIEDHAEHPEEGE
jgi:Asp-tRNA(Asn)/Glu-tRNA(Gln) amidotransferase A subunit family amidase